MKKVETFQDTMKPVPKANSILINFVLKVFNKINYLYKNQLNIV